MAGTRWGRAWTTRSSSRTTRRPSSARSCACTPIPIASAARSGGDAPRGAPGHATRLLRALGPAVPRLYVLVLSGGAGTRLWPLSRRDRPKQFLQLLGERSLLQGTVDRVSEFVPRERIFVVAPPEHRALIHEQLPELPSDHLVVEPYPRGNAAAVGLAMAALAAFDPDAVVAVLPSDHVVGYRAQFRKVLIAATAAAERGHLVTLGITPERPDTGFGYIEATDKLDIEAPVEVRAVKRFVEKPKREAAERMVAAGGHYWNAGMFVWRVEEILRA